MMALIFVGIGTGLIIWGGGFEKLNGFSECQLEVVVRTKPHDSAT